MIRNAPLRAEIAWGSDFVRRLVNSAPAVKGNWFFAASALRLLPPSRRKVIVSFPDQGNLKVEFDLGNSCQFSMIRNPQLDLMTGSVIWQLLSEGDTFVDVGTSFGYFTTIASQRVGAAGLVLGVEANRQAFATLLDTLARHGLSNAVCVHHAASETEGERVSIVRPFYRQTAKSHFAPANGTRSDSDVITTTLDILVRRVRAGRVKLVKIDTEGADLLVLRGASALVREQKPHLIVEVSKDYSRRFGYRISELYELLAIAGYRRAYKIVDDAGQEGLLGPLTGRPEGQILFIQDPELGVETSRPH